ncbi:Hypothetical_protein [Hexamita inflata]|uniref:Hypothetical_protein n=1 Tax=Hexamita inflata TaxID=28002 RepID=A0AA86U6U9_9EUKA|nr:Hypothetical protein HINF_LOCUS29221 [Hexamita inflata]
MNKQLPRVLSKIHCLSYEIDNNLNNKTTDFTTINYELDLLAFNSIKQSIENEIDNLEKINIDLVDYALIIDHHNSSCLKIYNNQQKIVSYIQKCLMIDIQLPCKLAK